MDSMHDKGRTFPDAKILNFPERTMSEREKDTSFCSFAPERICNPPTVVKYFLCVVIKGLKNVNVS